MNNDDPEYHMTNNILPPYACADLIIDAVPVDERVWVPQAENVWFRPLLMDTVGGRWWNLLRVRRSGVLSRHRHPGPVFGYVIKGHWHYEEHDFIASPGKFLFEPPGETHTLVVDSDDEMITMFNVNGAMVYVDDDGRAIGYEDVFSKIQMCIEHYSSNGLGADFIETFVR
ncbi:MAG: 2,4'-dihydroxyacetophenone dioxygenase family protein [Planctomycetales bacterium]|nr:2,4'-dihydroxyacetophenone dioxygenase family protein [Planctomycetales bacterium]